MNRNNSSALLTNADFFSSILEILFIIHPHKSPPRNCIFPSVCASLSGNTKISINIAIMHTHTYQRNVALLLILTLGSSILGGNIL